MGEAQILKPDEITAELFKKQKTLCNYAIYKDEAQKRKHGRFDTFIKFLDKVGAPACLKVLFNFEGYDDDKREIYVIPAAREYVQWINNKYPYFWYYAIPTASSFLLFSLLHDPQRAMFGETKVKFNFSDEQRDALAGGITQAVTAYGMRKEDPTGAAEAIKAWHDLLLYGGDDMKLLEYTKRGE